MNLVVGATGLVGGEICRRLVRSGKPVRALVRSTSDPDRVAALEGIGAEVVTGDLRDRASLADACRGADAVFSTAATTISRQPGDSIDATDRNGQKDLVDAAAAGGADRFVCVSVASGLGAEGEFLAAKRAVEEHIRSSGLCHTILGPTSFMEIWLGPVAGFDIQNGRARLLGDGTARHSWISLGDVAEFAVRSLDNSAAEDRSLDLGGPEALSGQDVVRIFEEETGRSFDVERVPLEALEAQRQAAADPYERTFAGLMYLMATAETVIDMDRAVQDFGVALTSVRDYARRSLAPAAG